MIDTISFTTAGTLHAPFNDPSALPPPWKAHAHGGFRRDPEVQSFKLECKSIGLRLFFRSGHLTSAEVDLPKLLWGHNGRLITMPSELNDAFAWLDAILKALLKPAFPHAAFIPGDSQTALTYHFTRVDLCWHFPSERGIYFALSHASHEKIRSSPSFFRDESVSHKGSFLAIKCYDKVRQLKVHDKLRRVIHRVEFSLRNKALKEIYPRSDGTGYINLSLDWCMDTIRKIAAETYVEIPRPPEGTIAQFIAHLEFVAPMLKTTDLYIHYRGMARQPERRFRKAVASYFRGTGVPQFKDYFPADHWPPACHVELPDVEAEHRAWLPSHLLELQSIAETPGRLSPPL